MRTGSRYSVCKNGYAHILIKQLMTSLKESIYVCTGRPLQLASRAATAGSGRSGDLGSHEGCQHQRKVLGHAGLPADALGPHGAFRLTNEPKPTPS